MIMPIFNALEEMNPSLISASRDLGANSYETFSPGHSAFVIERRQKRRTSSFHSFSFTLHADTFDWRKPCNHVRTAIEQHFLVTQNWGMGSTIGVILIIAMFLVMLLTGEKKKEDKRK